ncbi:MAG: histidinol-phosphate transaminase [Legionellales bacterium]|nr:histidinol-phosphate transaminase [Legionellales bacterium]|tara:strand:+ start:5040 stop:6140 length:1101 start_codon:yes stop_codon:yes gene_type:complete
MVDFSKLTNASVRNIKPYQPGKRKADLTRETGVEDIIKLASNESPIGPNIPAIKAAFKAARSSYLYPDGAGRQLKLTLAERLGVEPQQITLGNGSENILQLLAQVFLAPGDNVVLSQYGFITYRLVAEAQQADIIEVPMRDWQFDIEAIAQAVDPRSKLLCLANPNNPTGGYITHQQLETLLNSIPDTVIVVIDEAYLEFVAAQDYPDSLALLREHPNLVITRTFSKAYGLAGLRLGYSISCEQIAGLLNQVRLPFNVNAAALAAGEAAIIHRDYIHHNVSNNHGQMLQLRTALADLGLECLPSQGNFLMVAVPRDGQSVFQELLQLGIIVRPLTGYGLANHLRISIGLPEHNLRLLEGLKKVLSL